MRTGGITMKLEGSKELQRSLNKLSDESFDAARHVVLQTILAIHKHAVNAIQRGPKTGRLYKKSENVTHRASAPGEPPATDEGNLVSRIKWVEDGKLSGAVGTSVDYGPHLEFGTRRMKARPWLTPAVESERDEYIRKMTEAIRSGITKHTKGKAK